MSDPTNTKRARAANKIITLTGLGGTKGINSVKSGIGGGQGYPSFRFSPDSEEIQEVLTSSVSTGALRKSTSGAADDLLVIGSGGKVSISIINHS